jgi:hypothetical protein
MLSGLVLICAIIGLSLQTQLSLIDFRACQERFNCTKTLQPADCPAGQYLDVHTGDGRCCHGCRTGIGMSKLPRKSRALILPFRSLLSRSERGESGCRNTNKKKLCQPGLMCDDDFYCILNRSKYFRVRARHSPPLLLSLSLSLSLSFSPFTFSLMSAHHAL